MNKRYFAFTTEDFRINSRLDQKGNEGKILTNVRIKTKILNFFSNHRALLFQQMWPIIWYNISKTKAYFDETVLDWLIIGLSAGLQVKKYKHTKQTLYSYASKIFKITVEISQTVFTFHNFTFHGKK